MSRLDSARLIAKVRANVLVVAEDVQTEALLTVAAP